MTDMTNTTDITELDSYTMNKNEKSKKKSEMNEIITKVENDIMKILTRNADQPVSQFKLFVELCENYDILSNIEKEELKLNIITVLRCLKNRFENIVSIYKNNIFVVSYTNKEDIFEDDDYNLILYKSDTFPTEKEVICHIIDKKIMDYYDMKDYNGNNILHNLIIYDETERIKHNFRMFDVYNLINSKNNENKSPIELNNNIEIANLFIKKMASDLNKVELDINKLKFSIIEIEYNNKEIVNKLKKEMDKHERYNTHNAFLFLGIIVYLIYNFLEDVSNIPK